MAPRWRLEVEGLGRIERAEVDIHPLMLFVGPNNTGKSYLASLLWGLLTMQGSIEPPEGPALQACDEWLERHIAEGRQSVEVQLATEDIQLFDRLFESSLDASRDRVAARIFNSESTAPKRLAFRNVSSDRSASLMWELTPPDLQEIQVEAWAGRELGQRGEANISFRGTDLRAVRAVCRRELMLLLTFGGLTWDTRVSESFSPGNPIYLPASRTGFMQLYKATARRSLRGAFRPEAEDRGWLDLTTPAFHFIDMIAFGLKPKEGSRRFAEEADLLEEALEGRVELISGDVGINEFRYFPKGDQISLPMRLSSSVVTELAPLVVSLRHLSGIPVLILEEPEAHLHPELQRRLAQVVVRLIRKGVYVWITTHGENFCQQINSFIKLGALDPERRAQAQQHLNYGPQDYLDVDEVAGYEFKLDEAGQRSHVVEMKKKPRGIVMPTFNKALMRLAREVDYLDGLDTEA